MPPRAHDGFTVYGGSYRLHGGELGRHNVALCTHATESGLPDVTITSYNARRRQHIDAWHAYAAPRRMDATPVRMDGVKFQRHDGRARHDADA